MLIDERFKTFMSLKILIKYLLNVVKDLSNGIKIIPKK